MELSQELSDLSQELEQHLIALSQKLYHFDSHTHRASHYALTGPGKRVRPMLALLSTKACRGHYKSALDAAVAIEMIHSYSLVHDDLPCMDNDDLRRGCPTCHKAYGEDIALLAGDSLLTDAFSVIARSEGLSEQAKSQMILTLSEASGSSGMILGQDKDLYWTGTQGYTLEDLIFIHKHKTARLIAASCKIGGIIANATPQQTARLESFGLNVGIAFQIVDDLLDVKPGTGKSQGKDQEQGKLTFLAIMKESEANELALSYTREAFSQLGEFGQEADSLRALGEALLHRKS